MTLHEYAEELDRLESHPDLARFGPDPAFGARVIHRELTQALWQPWVRAEATALTERAYRLIGEMTEGIVAS